MASFSANPSDGNLNLSAFNSGGSANVTFNTGTKKITVSSGATVTITINVNTSDTIEKIAIKDTAPSAEDGVALGNNFTTVDGPIQAKKSGTTVILQDTNNATTTTSYNFWLKIGNSWYDPQIENTGSSGSG